MNTFIYQAGALGDSLATLPLITGWRRAYPDAKIALMGRADFGRLLVPRGLIDEALDCQSLEYGSLFTETPPGALRTMLSSFDVAFVLAAADSPLITSLREAGILHIRSQPPFPDEPMHIVDYHLKLLDGLCPEITDRIPRFPRGQELSRCTGNNQGDRPLVLLHPGSGSRRKNWPLDRFAALSDRLMRRGFGVQWLMGPAEKSLVAPEGVQLLVNQPLEAVAMQLRNARLYIGNDSGISHLAAAVGTPSIVLFGPSDSRIWAPRGERVHLVCAAHSCAPCHPGESPACSKECMSAISLERVWDACLEELEG
jgi:ADP-heptose:LPS heptosyltransferase